MTAARRPIALALACIGVVLSSWLSTIAHDIVNPTADAVVEVER